ncbi:MAG: LLM class flavin-dependent oxidoreductase [Paracoccaceae bacterium]|nr:LLM class flavin-dependent oxidoreductase [Paracoccaceae bacterium]
MEFSVQLSAYYPDKDYGGDRLYADMLEQAALCDACGYDAVSITEHHLLNILLMPAPLQFAVKIASLTKRVKIMTSVVVLPIHDMRILAGEIVVADIFTDGRLLLGVGRGAFGFEMDRLGVPLSESRARFDESLDVLTALLREEEVAWDGDHYQFSPLTIMPRPIRPGGPPVMMAVMNPDGIYHCTRRGFHIQTTPLAGNHQLLLDQVAAFTRAKAEMGEAGRELTLSLSRVAFAVAGAPDANRAITSADDYYARFDNVFTGPGIVDAGMIRPLPRSQTRAELAESLLVATPDELIDKLKPYEEAGIDRVILNMNFGAGQAATLESIRLFAEEVMPHFSGRMSAVGAGK